MPQDPPIDRIDRRILAALQRDGRVTNQRLSEEVALSPSACLARVKRLEKSGVITGYRAQVDRARPGSCLVAFAELTASAHDIASTRRIEAALRDMPQAVEAYQVSGNYDYLVRFLVADMGEWTRLSDEIATGELRIDTVKTVAAIRVLKGWSGIPIDMIDGR